MATLRKDGRWMARSRGMSGYGRTPEEADADLQRKLNPTHSIGERPTLHDVAKALWYPQIGRLKPLTQKKYEGVYVTHIRPVLGARPIDEITAGDVQRVLNAMTAGARTVGFARHILGQILKTAEAERLLNYNAARFAKVPPPPRKRERVLTVDEAGRLLEGVAGTEISAPVFLAAVLGLRRGEIAGLRWDDLDRQRGELRIVRQRQAVRPSGVIEADLKSGSSRRTLRLTKGLIAELDARGDLDSPHVCTRASLPWVPDTITERWVEARAKLGLPDWTFHDLRHGSGGLLYAAGCDLLQIAAVLGHSKPDMSWLYASASQERREKAVEELSSALGFGRH
jgi:integrase